MPNELPTDIWHHVLQYLHTSELCELFCAFPELRSFSNNLQTVFIFIKEGQVLPKKFKERLTTDSAFILPIPLNNVEELKFGCKQALLRQHLDIKLFDLLNSKEMLERFNRYNHHVTLQLAYDLESPSTYEVMELYPFIWHHFKNIPHSVEILKEKQDSILNFTKSKYHSLNLFECCYSSTLQDNQSVFSKEFSDIIVDSAPQIMQLKTGELIRTTHYFQDLPLDLKHQLLNVDDSSLVEISVVTPMIDELNPQKHVPSQYRGSDNDFKDHELSFTFTNWDIKMANLSYDTLIKSNSDSIKTMIQDILNNNYGIMHPFPTLPTIKLSETNQFHDVSYPQFYEIIYNIFNNSSKWELPKEADDQQKNKKILNDFWKKYIHQLYDHVYVSYHYQLKKGMITPNEPKFLKVKLLNGESPTGSKDGGLVEGYIRYFKKVYHSDSRHLGLLGLLKSVAGTSN